MARRIAARYRAAMLKDFRPHSDGSTGLPKLAFTREEAAKILNISVNSLDRVTARGLLKPSRALRRPMYSLAELERFLETTKAL